MACEVCKRPFFEGEQPPDADAKPHVCRACGRSFSLKIQLKRHILTHAGGAPYTCVACAALPPRGVRRAPAVQQEDARRHCCELCGKRFARRSALDGHLLTHHAESEGDEEERPDSAAPPPPAAERPAPPRQKRGGPKRKKKRAATVEVVHEDDEGTTDGRYACDLCPHTFDRKSSLKRHGRCHMQEIFGAEDSGGTSRAKKYACETCGRRFVGETCLAKHRLRHEEGGESRRRRKPRRDTKFLSCEYCGEDFTGRKTLFEKHRQAHTPEVCGICDERFVSRDELREHCRIHIGTEEGKKFVACSQKALDAKNGLLPPEPKVEYIYLVIR